MYRASVVSVHADFSDFPALPDGHRKRTLGYSVRHPKTPHLHPLPVCHGACRDQWLLRLRRNYLASCIPDSDGSTIGSAPLGGSQKTRNCMGHLPPAPRSRTAHGARTARHPQGLPPAALQVADCRGDSVHQARPRRQVPGIGSARRSGTAQGVLRGWFPAGRTHARGCFDFRLTGTGLRL